MLSRTQNASFAARAASMRRLRRRTASNHRLYCPTNGCASFMELDLLAGLATCPTCGARRRLD
jgi:hypothetical protein